MQSIKRHETLSRKPVMSIKNISDSVKAKLKTKAISEEKDLSLVLTRYALERFLYRLSISRYANQFLLKGALLFDLWFDVPFRATRDIDLLGFGSGDTTFLTNIFSEICSVECADGLFFESASIRAEEIRKEANYTGVRISLNGFIGSAKCVVQVDVGYGDAVTPEPEQADYPVMLSEFPAPRLRVYPRYTVIAEKVEAIISLGMANSRLKDYFDLWILLNHTTLDANVLKEAVNATVKRRATIMPIGIPLGLSDQFGGDPIKRSQWFNFASRNRIENIEFSEVVNDIRMKLKYLFVSSSADTADHQNRVTH